MTQLGVAVAAFVLGALLWTVEAARLPYDVILSPDPSTGKAGAWILGKNGGATLRAGVDADGDTWMLDEATGVQYLDGGDPSLGVLAATPSGDMFNIYVDAGTGKVMEKRLGNVDDLITIDTGDLMGLATGFPRADSGPLPPNAPLGVDPRTGEQEYPPFLEDRVLELRENPNPLVRALPDDGLRSDGIATERDLAADKAANARR